MRQVFAKCISKIFVLGNIFAKNPPPLKKVLAKICAVRQMSYAARKNELFCKKILHFGKQKLNGDFFTKM